jgi:hypothetical protein
MLGIVKQVCRWLLPAGYAAQRIEDLEYTLRIKRRMLADGHTQLRGLRRELNSTRRELASARAHEDVLTRENVTMANFVEALRAELAKRDAAAPVPLTLIQIPSAPVFVRRAAMQCLVRAPCGGAAQVYVVATCRKALRQIFERLGPMVTEPLSVTDNQECEGK